MQCNSEKDDSNEVNIMPSDHNGTTSETKHAGMNKKTSFPMNTDCGFQVISNDVQNVTATKHVKVFNAWGMYKKL